MIKKINIFGWRIWVREQNELHYISSLQDYLDGKASIVRVFKQNEETKVCLVETTNGLYVIKDFSPSQKHLERFLKSWIKKDYYVRLFQQTSELFNGYLHYMVEIGFSSKSSLSLYNSTKVGI